MVSPQKAAWDTVEAGLTSLLRALAVVLPSLALLQVLANARDYRQPVVAVLVWLAVLGAGTWLVPRSRAGGLTTGETAAAIAIAVAAVAAIGAVHRADSDPGNVNLAVLGTVWLLALVVMSHSARVWIPVALLVFAVEGALLFHGQGLNRLSLSQLGAAGVHHRGHPDRVRGVAADPGYARHHGRSPGCPGEQGGGGTRRGGRHQAGTARQARGA